MLENFWQDKVLKRLFLITIFSFVIFLSAAKAQAATDIFRSMGPGNTNELASSTGSFLLSISGDTASFSSGTIPNNVGVGDVLVFDSNNDNILDANDDIVFIYGRSSSTSYTVKNELGANTATTTSANDTWVIYRAYTSLRNALGYVGGVNSAFSPNSAIPVAFNNQIGLKNISTNATGTDQVWNIACYGDAPEDMDDGSTSVNGWTTGLNNYVRIFTPNLSSEVGVSQRHNGKWDDSKYNYIRGSLSIADSYTRVEGLQIQTRVSSPFYGILAYSATNRPTGIRISSNIVKIPEAVNNSYGIVFGTQTTRPNYVYNNIVYGFTGVGAMAIDMDSDYGSGPSYVYNNTVFGSYYGIYVAYKNALLKNNLAIDNFSDYDGTCPNDSDYNAYYRGAPYFEGGGVNNSNGLNISAYASSSVFVDAIHEDFRLSSSSPLVNVGADLSGDASLSFSVDLQNQTRSGTWDVGADEYAGESYDTTAPVVTTFSIPSSFSSTTIPVNSFGATDNVGVTGYRLTDSATAPSYGAPGWLAATSSSFTFSFIGLKYLYAWAKDAAGNVSTSGFASTTITLPSNTQIYRSVGPVNTNELASGTGAFLLTISSSTAAFSGGSLPANVGVGDVVVYDSNNDNILDGSDDLIFVQGRNSSISYTVKNESGANTATTTSANDTWAVYRAYTSLANAEAGIENVSIPVAFDNWTGGKDLIAANQSWNIACYGDNVDEVAVIVDGWNTGINNYLRIFTPRLSSEVGISQRHGGVWDNSKYNRVLPISEQVESNLLVKDSYVRVEGLQVKPPIYNSAWNKGIYVYSTTETLLDVWVSNNLVTMSGSATGGRGIHFSSDGSRAGKVYNNIVYGIVGVDAIGIYVNSAAGALADVYSNTVVNSNSGFYGSPTLLGLYKNNLSYGNVADFDIGGDVNDLSSHNAYLNWSYPEGTNNFILTGYASTTIFTDPANNNFTLKAGSPIINQGLNLAADPYLSFNDDINNQLRGSSWDIGADEYTDASDVTAPVISAIATSTSATTATITWTTDENASSTVSYGPTSAYGSASSTDNLITSHSLTIRGLTANTVYHFRVESTDALGNRATSSDRSFRTLDASAPIVTSFVIPATANTLVVPINTFTATDNTAVTGYLVNESSSVPLVSDPSWEASATTSYTFATPGSKTLYAWAKDEVGNISASANDGVLVDVTAPIISVIATSTSATTATITWTTDENASSTVGYGPTSAYGSASSTDNLITSHSLTIRGLTANTVYHFRVESTDALGNRATSSDRSFRTLDASVPTVTSFVIPATANSLIVAISSFTATDDTAVTGYLVNESSSVPSVSDPDWETTATTTYTFATPGSKTLYAWAKDAVGNISASANDGVTIDMSAPVISLIATSTTAYTATITWSTDELATSTVDYGANSSYGLSSSSDSFTTTTFCCFARLNFEHGLSLSCWFIGCFWLYCSHQSDRSFRTADVVAPINHSLQYSSHIFLVEYLCD
jgi:parallel beta-helix repeat protein